MRSIGLALLCIDTIKNRVRRYVIRFWGLPPEVTKELEIANPYDPELQAGLEELRKTGDVK